MINLLPPEEKRQIRARITNTLLLRYCIATLLLTIPLSTLAGGTYMIILNQKSAAEASIQNSQQKNSQYRDIQAEAEEFKNNLNTAKTILDKEIKYSQIALAIAQGLPDGISLDTLNLDANGFDQPIVLQLHGNAYGDAIDYKNALEKSPIFKEVHIQSITSDGENGGITVSISAILQPGITTK